MNRILQGLVLLGLSSCALPTRYAEQPFMPYQGTRFNEPEVFIRGNPVYHGPEPKFNQPPVLRYYQQPPYYPGYRNANPMTSCSPLSNGGFSCHMADGSWEIVR